MSPIGINLPTLKRESGQEGIGDLTHQIHKEGNSRPQATAFFQSANAFNRRFL